MAYAAEPPAQATACSSLGPAQRRICVASGRCSAAAVTPGAARPAWPHRGQCAGRGAEKWGKMPECERWAGGNARDRCRGRSRLAILQRLVAGFASLRSLFRALNRLSPGPHSDVAPPTRLPCPCPSLWARARARAHYVARARRRAIPPPLPPSIPSPCGASWASFRQKSVWTCAPHKLRRVIGTSNQFAG